MFQQKSGVVNFGSLYIRDEMIKETQKNSLTKVYENTLSRIRGHFYELFVLQKLKQLKDDLEVLCFKLGKEEMKTITIPAVHYQCRERNDLDPPTSVLFRRIRQKVERTI